MIVYCAECGKEITRNVPCEHNFCCADHRNQWMRKHVDFVAMARLHKAKHFTELNIRRNPLCSIAERGKASSKKARMAAEEYIGRPLQPGEVVHHLNGNATDNSFENLLVMTDREHKQLHMALAMEQLKGGDGNADQ